MIDEITAYENYVQDATTAQAQIVVTLVSNTDCPDEDVDHAPRAKAATRHVRLEAAVRIEIHEGLMRQGWSFCALHGNEYLIGWPDYHFVIPPDAQPYLDDASVGRAGYIEMKREKRKSEGLQKVIQERLRRAGALVVADCTGWAMVVEALQAEGITVR